jgi:hypothetical protein
MSRSRKIQTMHEYFHSPHKETSTKLGKSGPFHNTGAGYRYGNNRHMWAKLKVTMRKIERRKNNRELDHGL